MHQPTQMLAFACFALGAFSIYKGMADAHDLQSELYGYILISSGITFIMYSKLIGVLEQIRDKKPAKTEEEVEEESDDI